MLYPTLSASCSSFLALCIIQMLKYSSLAPNIYSHYTVISKFYRKGLAKASRNLTLVYPTKSDCSSSLNVIILFCILFKSRDMVFKSLPEWVRKGVQKRGSPREYFGNLFGIHPTYELLDATKIAHNSSFKWGMQAWKFRKHKSAIFGPIGPKIFMKTQETISYRLVMRNLSYDAYIWFLIFWATFGGKMGVATTHARP